MKKIVIITIVILSILMILFIVKKLITPVSEDKLEIEDIWGNKVQFNSNILTLIEPTSPSRCGYCLFDGEFVKENYFKNNLNNGGENFLQCLFNPQLDIYTFQKHYRSNLKILNFPPALHQLHRNGFPFLIALINDNILYNNILSPYENTFNILKEKFWEDINIEIKLTSPLQMATKFIWENRNNLTTFVIPDNDSTYFDRSLSSSTGSNNGFVKYEKDILKDDLRRNIFYRGGFSDFIIKILKDKNIPIELNEKSLIIGNYEFPQDSIAITICFPNPYNPEKYFVLRLSGECTKGMNIMQNWVDFTISKINPDNNKPFVIMNGLFGKNGNQWFYADSLTYINPEHKLKCADGICKVPEKRVFENHKIEFEQIEIKETSFGKIITLGKENCHFPEIATDRNNEVWCCWEENGDILLSSRNKSLAVENNESDSFNPVITNDGEQLWIFYLNNKTGFYRVYAKIFDGNRFSNEILISDDLINDAVNLGVTSDRNGKIAISWSEWQANFRIPKFRIIKNRSLGDINDINIKKSKIDYTNAWSPSLSISKEGKIWGAWNQHYPATLGVCSGDLISEAQSVTQLEPDEENGGYPDCLNDSAGKKWVFWESSGWDVLNSKSQQIKASFYSEKSKTWSLPYIISNDADTAFNQTPSAALDADGKINVVWSHRSLDDKCWIIYLSTYKDNNWTNPIQISEPNQNSRAPQIISNAEGKLFITWHSGIGKDIKIKLLEFNHSITKR